MSGICRGRGQYENISLDDPPGRDPRPHGPARIGVEPELALTLFGMTKPASGTVTLEGKTLALGSNRDAIAAGVAYVSEDRLQLGLVQPPVDRGTIRPQRSSTACSVPAVSYPTGVATPLVHRWIADLGIKIGKPEDAVSTLSGGQPTARGPWPNGSPPIRSS